jgi:hypothetical protein
LGLMINKIYTKIVEPFHYLGKGMDLKKAEPNTQQCFFVNLTSIHLKNRKILTKCCHVWNSKANGLLVRIPL